MGMFKKKNLKEGSFVLVLNQPFYLCGDNVTGSVCLRLDEELKPFRIAIKLKGKEKTKWQTSHMEKDDPGDPESGFHEVIVDHGDKKTAFRKEKTVHE
jgi:hypothetical protein